MLRCLNHFFGAPCVWGGGFALLACLAFDHRAHATTYFWDADGATPGFTALPTGTWGTDTFWSTDATGSSAGANTPITSTDDVNFGSASSGFSTTASTVTISGAQSVNSITFGKGNTANLTLSGGTSLTFGSGDLNPAFSQFHPIEPPPRRAFLDLTVHSSSAVRALVDSLICRN
jgi:hypothetical protein